MKKIILLLSLVFIASIHSYSQSTINALNYPPSSSTTTTPAMTTPGVPGVHFSESFSGENERQENSNTVISFPN